MKSCCCFVGFVWWFCPHKCTSLLIFGQVSCPNMLKCQMASFMKHLWSKIVHTKSRIMSVQLELLVYMVTGFHASSFNAKLMKTFIKKISWIFCRYVYLMNIKEKNYMTLMDVILCVEWQQQLLMKLKTCHSFHQSWCFFSIFMWSIENHLMKFKTRISNNSYELFMFHLLDWNLTYFNIIRCIFFFLWIED